MGYNWVHTTRLVVFGRSSFRRRVARWVADHVLAGIVSLFSVIVLALGAAWISSTESKLDSYYRYAALAVATSLLSFTVPAMYVLCTTCIVSSLNWPRCRV